MKTAVPPTRSKPRLAPYRASVPSPPPYTPGPQSPGAGRAGPPAAEAAAGRLLPPTEARSIAAEAPASRAGAARPSALLCLVHDQWASPEVLAVQRADRRLRRFFAFEIGE